MWKGIYPSIVYSDNVDIYLLLVDYSGRNLMLRYTS